MEHVEINQGEIKVNFDTPTTGKLSFADLGIKSEDLSLDGGLLRLVFDFENIGEHNYFQMPTLEFYYEEEMDATHWQCDFNGTMILDKIDKQGHSTILLLDRKKLNELEHRRENTLVVHAEFPKGVHIIPEKSFVQFFK